MISRDEFEVGYAERSGVTVEWLHEHGQRAKPCDCGDALCKGWQMASDPPLYATDPRRQASGVRDKVVGR